MSSPTSVLEEIGRARVVPVVVVDDAAQGLLVAESLRDGGLPVAEVTFRTAGAGTVVTPAQVDEAVAAGARFLVSPGLSAAVVRRAQEHGVPVLPGVATPSDIIAALDLGLDTVKLFPANVVGGPAAVKAFSAPFPGLRFVPTGGVGAANLLDYLALPSVLAAGGSWMVDRALVRAEDRSEIVRRTREAVELAASLSTEGAR